MKKYCNCWKPAQKIIILVSALMLGLLMSSCSGDSMDITDEVKLYNLTIKTETKSDHYSLLNIWRFSKESERESVYRMKTPGQIKELQELYPSGTFYTETTNGEIVKTTKIVTHKIDLY